MFENTTESEEWRLSQQGALKQALESHPGILEDQFNHNIKVEVKDVYYSGMGQHYRVLGFVNSKILGSYIVHWVPLQREFRRYSIFVSPKCQGHGIGTMVEQKTEEIARSLNCKSLSIESIIDTSLDYWRNHPDYVVQGTRAVKELDP